MCPRVWNTFDGFWSLLSKIRLEDYKGKNIRKKV